MLIKPDSKKVAKIKLVGIGGAGSNALTTLITQEHIDGVECIAVNTDAQALMNNKAETKLQIGEKITRGLGAGGNPDVGRQAAEESREKIKEYLDGADLVFITAGMGGGTGTGAAPIVADVARETGALTVAVITKPFIFEGMKRMSAAEQGMSNLKDKVDSLITVPNQRVLETKEKNLTLLEAFREVDSVLTKGVKGIAEIITLPGLINVDFADVKTIMQDSGTAIMGIGIASGEKRALHAVQQAITSSLIEQSLDGAGAVLFNIVGGTDLSMNEINDAAQLITKSVAPDAQIIFGAAIDDTLKDEMKITLVATRFSPAKKDVLRTSVSEKQNEQSVLAPRQSLTEEEQDELDIPAFLRRKI